MMSAVIVAAIADYERGCKANLPGLRLRFEHDEILALVSGESGAALARDWSRTKDEAAVSAGVGE